MRPKILVTGACGQLGTELVAALRLKYGKNAVIATDRRPGDGSVLLLDVLDRAALAAVVFELGVTQLYHLAAVLSASGEAQPQAAWELNIQGLLNVLNVAQAAGLEKVFWPSSIAVFGPGSPKELCTQQATPDPSTVYGISKLAGEQWCHYYHTKYGMDIRSLRYPGLISHSARPGGGTTDYAVEIFHQALAAKAYTCFLKADARLPMLYMADAVRATLELMDAPAAKLTVRTSYNLAGLSFTPAQLAGEIQRFIPGFKITYAPDFRQAIADGWPASVDDTPARQDWGWRPAFELWSLVADMLQQLQNLQTAARWN
jgi:nucleoside-diphosphate-sugar epimerase